MSRRPILERIRALALPADQFIVAGSGVMDVLGLRESRDIDLIVGSDLFTELRDRGWKRFTEHDEQVLKYGDAEAWLSLPVHGKHKTYQELLVDSVQIEEVTFVSPQFLLDWKRFENRPKDRKDIALLEEYISHGA